MHTGSGEFTLIASLDSEKYATCFYKTSTGFYKDINFNLPNNEKTCWHTIPITKKEYLKKLKYFTFLLTKEKGE